MLPRYAYCVPLAELATGLQYRFNGCWQIFTHAGIGTFTFHFVAAYLRNDTRLLGDDGIAAANFSSALALIRYFHLLRIFAGVLLFSVCYRI